MNEKLFPLEAVSPKIIKRRNQVVTGDSSKLIKHQILSAEEKARTILQKARNSADQLIADAEIQAEEIRREAHRAGRDQAESETIDNLLEMKEIRSQVLSTVEKDVLRLAVKLAEKVIGKEISQDESVRAEIVFNALRSARQQEMLTVRVNSVDLPLLERMRERIDTFGREQFIDFVPDQAVREGGCIIESQSGTIDARIETQLRILENALLARALTGESPKE